MSRVCAVTRHPANRVCGDPAVVRIVIGCRHEHIKETDACQWDADNLLSGDKVRGFCMSCEGLGHICTLGGKILERIA